VRGLLSALATLSGVQLAASVDHINAPMLWTSTELLAQRWLWHDLTTLSAYDVELAGADPTSLRSAPTATAAASMRAGGGMAEGMGLGRGGGSGQMMTETVARHVLAAVTQRARKLFELMGKRQLDALADAGGTGAVIADPTTPAEAGEVAVPYDALFNLARDQFVATNDTALRALPGEFRDHGLVVTVGTGVMEMLWIPLRKERLTKLLDGHRRWSEQNFITLRQRTDGLIALMATSFARLGGEVDRLTGYDEIEALKRQVVSQGAFWGYSQSTVTLRYIDRGPHFCL
jgi:origin recognition complex subunit 2